MSHWQFLSDCDASKYSFVNETYVYDLLCSWSWRILANDIDSGWQNLLTHEMSGASPGLGDANIVMPQNTRRRRQAHEDVLGT